MTIAKTLRVGDTADKRVLLTAAHGDVPTADPAATDSGWNLQGADFLHVYVELPGTMTALSVTLWYYSTVAAQWVEGPQLSFTPGVKSAAVEARGEERVFFVADAVTGTGTFKLWGAYSHVGEEM